MRFTARSANNWLRITIRPVIFEVGSYYHSVLAVFLLQTSLWRYFGCSCFTICGSYCTLILMEFAAPPQPNYSFWLLHVLMCFEYWLRLYCPQVSASNSISMWWLSSFPDFWFLFPVPAEFHPEWTKFVYHILCWTVEAHICEWSTDRPTGVVGAAGRYWLYSFLMLIYIVTWNQETFCRHSQVVQSFTGGPVYHGWGFLGWGAQQGLLNMMAFSTYNLEKLNYISLTANNDLEEQERANWQEGLKNWETIQEEEERKFEERAAEMNGFGGRTKKGNPRWAINSKDRYSTVRTSRRIWEDQREQMRVGQK